MLAAGVIAVALFKRAGLGSVLGHLVAGLLIGPWRTPARMTSAALLVVLGAALIMQLAGLSMALGAFVAGVMLSESTFRHQLEADVEPFRALLLGLFLLGVGMSLDVPLVRASLGAIMLAVVVCIVTKGVGIYLVARQTRAGNSEALYRTALLAQGGEFAFVL